MKNKNFTAYLARLTSGTLILFGLLLSASGTLQGQPVLGAQNTALGSGGTAYLSGFEATFWNPANMAIRDRQGDFHIGVGQTGILYEPVLSSDAAGDQFFNFTDSFYPFKPSATSITNLQRETILEKNYPRSKLAAQHQTRADIILGGVLWQREKEAYSIAARARFGSRIEVGRGWYSNEFISSGDQQVRDLTLNQQINQLFEISIGYAREFTFIDGLLPRLSTFYVGISPKFVLAGPSFNATYNARYLRSDNGAQDVYATDFFYRTTGAFSEVTLDYIAASNPQQAINNNLNRRFEFNNTGYGLGFDFGLTYLLPLGHDLSFLKGGAGEATVSKSLRISLSINDIGVIRYTDQPVELSASPDTTQIGQLATRQSMFIGAGGQYLNYFENASALPNPITSSDRNFNSYSTLLPTSINAGILIDLSAIKVMGDLTLGLNNTAFTSTKLAFHLGFEARPLEHVPIRLGTRLAAGIPNHFGMGTGIETRYWDLTVGAQIIIRSRTFTSEFVGGAFTGLKIHL